MATHGLSSMALTLLPRKTLDMTKWPKIRSIVIYYVKEFFKFSVLS